MDRKFEYNGVQLDSVRNRNEQRVLRFLPQVLDECQDYKPTYLDIQDIFALTLNNLPPRYAQSGSIVLRESVSDEDILRELRAAVERVETSPTGRGEE